MWAGVYDHTRTDQQISATVGSAGTASGALGPVPEGFCWYIERETCQSNTAATTGALLEVFVSTAQTGPVSPDKTGLQDASVGASVAENVSDNQSPIFLEAGKFLVAQWSGLTQNDLVRYTAQIRVHQLLRSAGEKQRPIEPEKPVEHHEHKVEGISLLAETAHLLADAAA